MARVSTTKRVIMIANIVALLGFAGSSVYFFMKYSEEKENNSLTTEQKNKNLVEEINKVFDLPDEEPVVAIVTDPDEFKKQYAAFDNAESGDYLLFFRKARLNVLYRQDEKRVVKTANVIVPITVELVGDKEAIDEAATKLADFGTQITIVKTEKSGITQSFVFDIDDDQKAETESISKQIGFEIGATLPSSIETGDQTEIIIAVASNSALTPTIDTTQTTESQTP